MVNSVNEYTNSGFTIEMVIFSTSYNIAIDVDIFFLNPY